MKKQGIISIFMAFCLILTSSFMNVSSAATVEYFDELVTDEMLLSDLIYDDYILKQKVDESINIKNYTEFYEEFRSYIDRGDIMYENLNQLANRLSKYKLKLVSSNKTTGFEGAVFERDYNGKRHLTVVFRGTELDKLNDVATDLGEVVLHVSKYQRNDALNLVKNAVKLSTRLNPVDEISITGHSLGGFLAQSVSAEIEQNNIYMGLIDWRTSTFNAPGLSLTREQLNRNIDAKLLDDYLNYIENLKLDIQIQSKITNYIISSDIVGNFGKHTGKKVIYNDGNKLDLAKYHSLYHFHKYGDWYKMYLSKAIVKSVYENETEVKGRADANKTVELYINDKKVKDTYTNDRGEYKFTIAKQSAGTKIEVKYMKSMSNYVSTTTTVKDPLKVNKLYYGENVITGQAYPYADIEVYTLPSTYDEIMQKIGEGKADVNGNFKITLPGTYAGGMEFRVRAEKLLYPTKVVDMTILKLNISTLTLNKLYSASTTLSGKTISGAKVTAYKGSKKLGSTVTADKDGNFKITIGRQSEGSKIKVVASKTNYNNKETTTTVVKSPTVKLTVNPKYYNSKTISGTTTSGATVEAYYGNTKLGKVVADKSGNYKITTDRKISVGKTITVKASKTNYYNKQVNIKVQNNKISTLTLNKLYSASTTLSGKTISGAKVTAYKGSKKLGSSVTADKNGNFKITIGKQSAGSKIKVVASKTNYSNKEATTTVVKSPTVKLTVNAKYYNSNTISGTTTKGAIVEAYYGNSRLGKVVADKDGNYKITTDRKISVGKTITVKASKTNYYNKQVNIKVQKSKIFNLTASNFYTNSTTISGKTTAGATVKAYVSNKQVGKTATADKNGNYKITGIKKQSAKKVITVKATKKNHIGKSVNVTVKAASTVRLPFLSKGKIGYMDETGRVVIKPQFNYWYNEMDDMIMAGDFYNNRALVYTSSDKVRYIDTNGKYINNYTYDYGFDFSENMAVAYRNGKYRFINTAGKEVFSTTYNVGQCFREGLIRYEHNGKEGYMDKNGKIVIKAQYGYVKNFHNGYALVELMNGQSAIIDKKGNNKTAGYNLGYYANTYSYDQPVVSEGMFHLKGEGYVFADINNPSKIKIYNKIGNSLTGFDSVGVFKNGLAPVSYNGKWGYIDKTGKRVIDFTYDLAGYFQGNYATVLNNGYIYVINKSGKVVSKGIEYLYSGAFGLNDKNIIEFNNGSGYKYYDLKGNQIKPKL